MLSVTCVQVVEVIDPFARNERLLQLLQEHHSSRKNRMIIFVLYKKEAPQVEQLLNRKGWKVRGMLLGKVWGKCELPVTV